VASRRLALGSLVRAKTKPEAERVGKYMLRPILALERLTFLEPEGKVGYRWGWMKIVAFITEVSVLDRIIDHLKLEFVADRPQPCSPHGFQEGRRPMSSSRLS